MQETTISATDDKQSRLIATLSYFVPFLFIYPLIKRDDALSLFHAKQVLSLWTLSFGISMVCMVLAFVPVVGLIAGLASMAIFLAAFVMCIMGALNAWNEKMDPLPVVGALSKRYLAAIQAS
ncbi:MAG: DUF4870 domain-containing protein [Planctomycetota bacterium]|jgi:uncharacterized membrane protein